MDKQQLLARLMSTFVAELDDNLRSLNTDLLRLEKSIEGAERTEILNRLFRAAHSLKGAARSINQNTIESICHQLEDKLAALRDNSTELTPEAISSLFASVDLVDRASQTLKSPAGDGQIPSAPSPPTNGFLPAEPVPSSQTTAPERSPNATMADSDFAMVRVAAHKLDILLAWSGELLVARRRMVDRLEELANVGRTAHALRRQTHLGATNRPGALLAKIAPEFGSLRELDGKLQRLERELDTLTATFASDIRALEQAAGPVEEQIRQIRMLPFVECCQGLDRLVRDLSKNAGKEVELVIEGESVELDRAIIEQLRDPMRHLVRNALSHGIEVPEERVGRGKPAAGRIAIKAITRGAHVEISIGDDGRGLDLDAIRIHAQDRLRPNADPAEIARAVFLPGVSTASTVDELSGRGVGLDAVKTLIEAQRGSISVSWIPGGGTTFLITVPLTLAIMRGLLLRSGGQIFAVPTAHVRKLLRFKPAEIRRVGQRDMLLADGGQPPILIVSLDSILGLSTPAPSSTAAVAVIVTLGDLNIALAADQFLAEHDLMVKTLGRRIRKVSMISGATLLASGEVALVLNIGNVVRAALGVTAGYAAAAKVQPSEPQRKRLIVADDSITTLSLEKSILEAAGYEVGVAANGQAAWQLLESQGADLLVSDIDMPEMDGFGLTTTVRRSERFHDLPVVLVTARASDADRARGLELGASAYLVKSAFDQEQLLNTVAQLL